MSDERRFLIGDRPGFSPQIARLVSMLTYARETTLEAAAGLDVAALDFQADAQSNSIAALLLHVAAVETWYQAATFEGRELDAGEMREWEAPLDLGERARREIRGHDLDHYAGKLSEVRARTLSELARRDDRWLEEETPFWKGLPANNHFKWFHVLEDELSHRGQIRWLRKRAERRDPSVS